MRECAVLVVEDEEYIREYLDELLTAAGYNVSTSPDGESGTEAAVRKHFNILLTDLKLPGKSGIDVIRAAKAASPATQCIILTGHPAVETAVEAMRAGAFTYLTKPFSKDELLVTLEKARDICALEEENTKLRREVKRKYTDAILGSSAGICEVKETIDKIADTDTTVIILGESGTGKELVARGLHYGSSRSNNPFVPINCGAIPEDLLESELFGHEKGAFTGAVAAKIGRFEAADNGTIFLDEVGDMSPGLQVKILRVLQEKEFERVGGRNTIKVDVRVVAATNQDLEQAVEEKRFRKDLYYRLNVIPIRLPSLKERKEDIALLATEFLKRLSHRKKKHIKGITPEAVRMFEAYSWPGNIRELENLIERLVVLKDDFSSITPKDLPEKIRGRAVAEPAGPMLSAAPGLPPAGTGSGIIDFNGLVASFERELILNALNSSEWVKKKAAESLSLNRTTLIEKMKRIGLSDKLDPSEGADSTHHPAGAYAAEARKGASGSA